ncbi:MAG: hypothetical protein HDQ88_05715 [Clostridia bacterium]|nr:hypothetical protein [Clostridia bacterium]
MANSKIETFIGFCIKSSKITYGSGAIATLRQGVQLIILDGASAKNSKRLALKYANRFSCPLLICKTEFERIVNKEGCKLCAVRDGELAKAILANLDDNYELYAGGSI